MKDCWHEDPDERLEFTEIETRLNNPFHSYQMIVSTSDSEEGSEHLHAEQAGKRLRLEEARLGPIHIDRFISQIQRSFPS